MELLINNVGKLYKGKILGLKDFSLTLGPGILGLCGPNGAGKSTLMRILATITQPSEGSAFWNGEDIQKNPNAVREVLGYLPQDFGVYPNLNAVEFLEYMAAIKGLDNRISRQRISELLQIVNLFEVRKQPLGGYSGGMKQRVGIAQALLNDPKLLIVDEPTAGLDPEERVRFRNLLSDLSGDALDLSWNNNFVAWDRVCWQAAAAEKLNSIPPMRIFYQGPSMKNTAGVLSVE